MVNVQLRQLRLVDAHLLLLLHVDEALLHLVPRHVQEKRAGDVERLGVERPDLQVKMKMVEHLDEPEHPKRTRNHQANLG